MNFANIKYTYYASKLEYQILFSIALISTYTVYIQHYYSHLQ